MTGLASDSKHEQSINDGMFPDAGRGPGRKHGVNDFVLMDPSMADVVQVALALCVRHDQAPCHRQEARLG